MKNFLKRLNIFAHIKNYLRRRKERRQYEYFLKVRDIIAEVLKLSPNDKEKITPTTRFLEDLKVDSLSALQISVVLEREFEVEVPDRDIDKLLTVQDVVEYVDRKILRGEFLFYD